MTFCNGGGNALLVVGAVGGERDNWLNDLIEQGADLGTVVPSIAGPKRPQDRIILTESKAQFRQDLRNYVKEDLVGGSVDEHLLTADPDIGADYDNHIAVLAGIADHWISEYGCRACEVVTVNAKVEAA